MLKRGFKLFALAFAALTVLTLAGRWIWLVQAQSALAEEVAIFEREVGPLDLTQLGQVEPSDPDDNIARWLMEAASATDFEGFGDSSQQLGRLPIDSWTPASVDVAAELTERNSQSLSLAERVVDSEACSFGLDYAAGADLAIPPVVEILRLTKLLQITARAALHKKDVASALARIRQLRAASRCLRGEPLLIFQMVGIAVEQQAQTLTAEVVESGLVDVADLRVLKGSGDRADDQHQLVRSLAGEGSLMLSMASEPGEAYGRVLSPLVMLEMVRTSLEHYRLMAETVRQQQPLPQIDLSATPTARFGPFFSFDLPTPNLDSVVGRARAVESFRGLHDLALAVRLAGLEHGVYPATLEGFDGSDISSLTGEPIAYRHDDGAVVLEIEGAAEVWASFTGSASAGHLPSRWRLPPIDRPAS